MFKISKNRIISFGIILAVMFFADVFFYSNLSYAAVSLPWSSTYNCADWTQGQALNCDGMSTYGGWTTANGSKEQITAAANYLGGAGGKGQRHWLGDGAANNSGGLNVSFSSPQSEIRMRWYMRYEQGFMWQYLIMHKMLYFNKIIMAFQWSDQTRVHDNTSSNLYDSVVGKGWNGTMQNGGIDANGNRTSDGQWHLYELHFKVDTNGSNGIVEVWIDQVQVINVPNANLGGISITHVDIGSNAQNPYNGRDMYVDYDDIVITNTGGYIGPIGGTVADTTAPSTPTNLATNVILDSQIDLTWTVSTDNVGVAGYNIYRDGVQIATSTTTSYSNTGLTASTAYSYTVSAYDAAGNNSTQITPVSATTQALPDTTPPAAPTGLAVN